MTEKAALRAVAFDLDGTLANTLPAMVASWNAVVGPLIGREIPADEIVGNLGPRAVEIAARYAPDNAEAVSEALSADFLRATQVHARLYPGVAELVAKLSEQGRPIGVVTSMRRMNAIPLLTFLGLIEQFPVVITEDDVPRLKPDPVPVLMTAEALQVDPAELLVIGDNPTDMMAARAAGATGAAAVWGFYGRRAAPHADHVLEQPLDALRHLR